VFYDVYDVLAVIDDVISLALISEIDALSLTPTAWSIARPIVASVGAVFVGVIIAFFVSRMILYI